MKSIIAALALVALLAGTAAAEDGGMIIGGPLNGTFLPGSEGGMVIGGPLNGTFLPGKEGGMVIGGPLNGTFLPPGTPPVILVPVPSDQEDD